MLKDKTLTYISLFSCAGVGCFGFKKAGFECIATNELIERRLNVQKFNNKCKYESGYICDDITTDETKDKIFAEIKKLRLKNPNVLSEVLKAFYFEQLPEAVKNYIKNNKIFLNLSFERSPWRVMCNLAPERDINSIIYSFEL